MITLSSIEKVGTLLKVHIFPICLHQCASPYLFNINMHSLYECYICTRLQCP